METSSAAVALLQGRITATVQQTTPAAQCMECNPQERAREQKPEPGHSTRGHTEIKSQQDWNGAYCPQKALPTTRTPCNRFLCPEKTAVLQLFIHFLLYSRRGKIQLSKMAFQNLYTGKNCAVATQELNKHHTVTPMDGLHFSFTSQHRKTYFSSSWLFNPSFCSKWIRLGFNQFLFGPNSFRHTGKFNIEQNTEVK